GLDLAKILAIATGGLGLVIYFLSFGDDVGGYLRGLTGVLLLGGGLLAAASVLPKVPATLVPAAVAVATGTLFLLIDVAAGPPLLGGGSAVPGLAIVALILAFLELAAVVLALLMSVGLMNMPPRSRPLRPQSWEPQQSGGYPGQAAPGGYPGPPPPGGYPGQGGYPAYGGYPDQGTSASQGGYPGQYQPPAPPPSGYPVQPPQSYQPHTVQYQSLPDQYGQPQYGGQLGQEQYGGEPQSRYSGDEPGQASGERAEPERSREHDERPGTPPGQS
ncbi:MAG: DUF5336 domain-containing protein, partial [Pseudonocardiaceae bacterium]